MSEQGKAELPDASEARWRSLVEHNPDYILLTDRDTTIRYVNRTAHGFRQEDVVGRRADELVSPDFAATMRHLYEQTWDTGRPTDFESPVPSPDGTLAWYATRLVPIREGGRTVGLLAVARDVTGRKCEEESLRASEARWRALIESHPDQVLIFDRDGTIHFVNRLLPGVREEDVIGRDGFAFVPPEHRERTRAVVHEVWDAGVPADLELPANRPDGSPGWYHLRLAAIRREGRTVGLVASSRDVTERKRAEEGRAALEDNLRQAQKMESLGVLAGGIAHDFNNLLTGILGNANLARLDSPPGSTAVPYLDQIEQICLRAADLCRQMLAYAGKGRFVVERLDLNRVIGDMTHLLQVSISKSAELTFRPAPSLPPVGADASQLRQVVMNLVINASEAVGERGGVIGLATGVGVGAGQVRAAPAGPDLPPGEYVSLEVSDDGPGMTEEVRAKIFDPFFTTKFTGRGLGLAAVLGIVRGHKGAIEVASEPGRGTTIRVLFPRADGGVDAATAGEPSPQPWRGEGTILVADDEETVRVVTARMLESVGFRVVMAADGGQAVERFRADPGAYRLVLLDLTMPRLGGEEAFHELRLVRPDVPVILMSGYTEHEVTARFADKGLAGFLQKPFPLPALLAKVRQALG
jgi:two-component system cell cycle sensor histidine kinase/response regulator CckA